MKKVIILTLIFLSFGVLNTNAEDSPIISAGQQSDNSASVDNPTSNGNNSSSNDSKKTNTSKCGFDPKGGDIGDALNGCLADTKLVKANDASIETGLNPMIQKWINNISLYLGILAVLSIVIGSLMMVFSGGEDEKITKAKDVVKWGIIGFLAILSASAIINLIVKIIYSI